MEEEEEENKNMKKREIQWREENQRVDVSVLVIIADEQKEMLLHTENFILLLLNARLCKFTHQFIWQLIV